MATKSPVFPITEPHHFSDYGFDPQIDYFRVLEEARRQKKEGPFRSIDTLHFKLQKPISKDDFFKKKKSPPPAAAGKKRRWWKTALIFFKSRLARRSGRPVNPASMPIGPCSISGPIYVTESLCGSNAPFRATTSRPLSGPLSSGRKGELEIPYVSLRELNVDQPHRISTTSPMPIYLVA